MHFLKIKLNIKIKHFKEKRIKRLKEKKRLKSFFFLEKKTLENLKSFLRKSAKMYTFRLHTYRFSKYVKNFSKNPRKNSEYITQNMRKAGLMPKLSACILWILFLPMKISNLFLFIISLRVYRNDELVFIQSSWWHESSRFYQNSFYE